ncbi:MAG: hypothetical protein WD003_02525 [Candidatus Paceibacterota bacterium]
METKILCVCFGNTCRSPMLQALLARDLSRQEFEIESAGLSGNAGKAASPHAIKCMQEKGLDITDHRSRKASDLNLHSYDHIYCVEKVLSQRLIELGTPRERIEVVEVSNPYGKDLATYHACAEVLSKIATTLARKLNQ